MRRYAPLARLARPPPFRVTTTSPLSESGAAAVPDALAGPHPLARGPPDVACATTVVTAATAATVAAAWRDGSWKSRLEIASQSGIEGSPVT